MDHTGFDEAQECVDRIWAGRLLALDSCDRLDEQLVLQQRTFSGIVVRLELSGVREPVPPDGLRHGLIRKTRDQRSTGGYGRAHGGE